MPFSDQMAPFKKEAQKNSFNATRISITVYLELFCNVISELNSELFCRAVFRPYDHRGSYCGGPLRPRALESKTSTVFFCLGTHDKFYLYSANMASMIVMLHNRLLPQYKSPYSFEIHKKQQSHVQP